jgi:hypothetical protein
VTFSSSTAGPVLVQVYNYSNGTPVNFQLQLSGVNQSTPAPAAPTETPIAAFDTPTAISSSTSGDGSPSHPFAFNGSATGQLPGNSAGSFVYYTMPYAGNGAIQSFTFNYSPPGAHVGNAVDVTVFQNGTQLTSVKATQNLGNAPGVVPVSFSSAVAGPVLIQIGNYNPLVTIDYSLSH